MYRAINIYLYATCANARERKEKKGVLENSAKSPIFSWSPIFEFQLSSEWIRK